MQAGGKTLPGGRAAHRGRRDGDLSVDVRGLYWYVAGIVVIFAALIAAGLFFGRAMLAAPPPAAAPPHKAVSHTPPGYYMRRLEDGRTCRVTVFDHDRGEAISDKITHCEEMPLPSMKRRSRAFSWGGQQP